MESSLAIGDNEKPNMIFEMRAQMNKNSISHLAGYYL
jgi:hypothetical protein